MKTNKSFMRLMVMMLALLVSLFMITGCSSSSAEEEVEETETPVVEVSGLTINVTIPEDYEGELTGRLLVMFDYADDDADALYYSLGATGIPVFGKTFYSLSAGDVITISSLDEEVLGFPFTLSELPEEDLNVQAFFIVYTEFNRTDLPTIWGMADHGGGGDFTSNPYNLYSDVQMETIDMTSGVIELSLTNEIPLGYELEEGEVDQLGNYEDTDNVKYVKIKSELLSEFWGCDMYLGANVLLPTDYDSANEYVTLYYQGHWPGGTAPLSYGGTSATATAFTEYWDSDESPNMVVITFRDANMFYDTSYSVDSASMGPYGEAIITELIPYLEEEFNLIDESWARLLSGGSTGGWESLAMQIFYPDFFGGTWSLCPDSVDFNHYQVVNLYEADNAYSYTTSSGWLEVEYPGSVSLDGTVRYMMVDENMYEAAVGGLEAVSLGQWAVWETVYGPVDDDGYPARVWDPITGEIDKDVVEYWKENYDLNYYLQENWSEIGYDLVGKIHIRGGDMDAYYLNHAQYLMGDFLESTTEPYYDGYSVTFAQMGHTGNITSQELIEEMIEHMLQYGPDDVYEILFG